MPDPTRLRVLYVRSRPLVQYARPGGDGEPVACAPDEEDTVLVPVPPLDDRLEYEAMVGILKDAALPISLHRLPHATGDDFTLEMSKGYDVVYFDGHGSKTALAFEGPNGECHYLDANTLAAAFEDSGTKLAVLSACHSSAQLNAVCQAGVPAAVGMTKAVPQPVAAAYTRGFFTALTQGKTLAQAHGLGLKMVNARMSGQPSDDELPTLLTENADIPIVVPGATGKLELTGKPPPSNITLSDGPFIGRNEEMVEANRALIEDRVVVLEGEPGIGKTALAQHVAAWQVQRSKYPGGVAFVAFDPPLSRDLAIDIIGTACIGEEFSQAKGNRLELLRKHFAEQPGLVVLDSIETVCRNAAVLRMVNDLSSVVRVLITTGEQIGIGKTVLVRELDDKSATMLFEVLAGDAGWHWDGDEDTVRAICVELGNMPLAIELVAPQAAALPLGIVLDRVKMNLANVAADNPTSPKCRRSIVAALDLSHNPLSEPARVLFRRMSVFAAGTEGPRLPDVCDVKDWESPVAELVRHRLVRFDDGRYTMLPPVRRYALDKLKAVGERDDCEERFARHFVTLSSAIHAGMNSAKGAHWMEVAGAERDNLLAAQGWFLSCHKWDEAKDMADRLDGPFDRAGLWTARRDLRTPLCKHTEDTGDKPGLADDLHRLAVIAYQQGDYPEALMLYGRSLAIKQELNDSRGIARTMWGLAVIAHAQGRLDDARQQYGQARAAFERLDDKKDLAGILHQLANLALQQGSYAEARKLYDQSLSIKQELNDEAGTVSTLHQLGRLAYQQNDPAEARRLYDQSLDMAERFCIKTEVGNVRASLAALALDQGNYPEAHRQYDRALTIEKQLGDKSGIAKTYQKLAFLAQQRKDLAEARELNARSLAIMQELGNKLGIAGCLLQAGGLDEDEPNERAALKNYVQAQAIFKKLRSLDEDMVAAKIVAMQQRLGVQVFKKLSDEVDAESD